MRNNEEIKNLVDYLKTSENKELTFDEEAIFADYQKEEEGDQSLAIKILSIFGGIFAAGAFLGFIFIGGLYDMEVGLLIFGVSFIAVSIWISKTYDKIFMDTISISFYMIGFILFGISLEKQQVSQNVISIIFIVLSLISLKVVQNYLISFVSVLIINGSVFTLIVSNDAVNLVYLYVSVLTSVLTYVFLKEAKIITTNKIFIRLYNPLRVGLLFSFVSILATLSINTIIGINRAFPTSPYYIWLSSFVIIGAIMYVLFHLFDVFNITKTQDKAAIYIVSALLLLPAVYSPAILGAILVILLSFLVNYRVGLVVGIIAFLVFVSQYYYNLDFTLLTKSILLLSSGVLFLALYLFIHKKLVSNEKI